MQYVLVALLLLGLAGGRATGTVDPATVDTHEYMEAILASPSVLVSEANVTTATQLLMALPELDTSPPSWYT